LPCVGIVDLVKYTWRMLSQGQNINTSKSTSSNIKKMWVLYCWKSWHWSLLFIASTTLSNKCTHNKDVILLNIKDCSLIINNGAHVAFSLLISWCLEPNNIFHILSCYIMFFFIINLAIWCKRTFTLVKGCVCMFSCVWLC